MSDFPLNDLLKSGKDLGEHNYALIVAISYLYDKLDDILQKLDEMQNDRLRTV